MKTNTTTSRPVDVSLPCLAHGSGGRGREGIQNSKLKIQNGLGRFSRTWPGLALAAFIFSFGASSFNPAHAATFFTQTNLVADQPGKAIHTDPNLVNAWGVAYTQGVPYWVGNNGTGTSTGYDGNGKKVSLVIKIQGQGGPGTGPVTGAVYNNQAGAFKNDTYIFDTEQGYVVGWNSVMGTNSALRADGSARGAVYKGLAIGNVDGVSYIYATDFHNGVVDVFNGSYARVGLKGKFVDPKTPKGYAPFNIHTVGTLLFVTFAKQDPSKHDELDGAGLGFVSVFHMDGTFVKRFASGSKAGGKIPQLNAPWGVAVAPSGFGADGGKILIGNFGNGEIAVFSTAGKYLGVLEKSKGHPVKISGLWEIFAGPAKRLYFSAGTDSEQHGLFGYLKGK